MAWNSKQLTEFNATRLQQFSRTSLINRDEIDSHRTSIWKIAFDVVGLLILLAATLVENYVAVPFEIGFYCSDTSIKYPYKANTIPLYAALILSILLPIFAMWITELCKFIYFRFLRKEQYVTKLEFFGREFNVPPVLRNIYILTVIFFYGYLTTWLLTNSAKDFLGALRPHFLARCRPSFNCSTLTSLNDFNRYLQVGVDFTCLNADISQVQEARRSFFSGHSSSIFYGFTWLIMYIHVAWSWRHIGIIGNVIQVGLAVLATYIASSRITDYQHHWQDVLFGSFVGALIAFFSFKFILNWQRRNLTFLPHVVPPLPVQTPLVFTRF